MSEDHRFSKFGNDGFALDNWEHIEEEEDENSFEISPYRNYTKDEEMFEKKGLRLRSTHTELPFIPESPLSAEMAIAAAKILAFKQKFFGVSSIIKSAPRHSTRKHSLKANIVAEEYTTDNEDDDEDTTSDDGYDVEQSEMDLPSTQTEHVPHVVAQIQDIMKHPSTHLEAE
eukprot:g6510.t1